MSIRKGVFFFHARRGVKIREYHRKVRNQEHEEETVI